MMSYEMPFYDNDNQQLKGQMLADDSSVATLLTGWKGEENGDIEAILQSQADHQVPTFNGNSRRPGVLDLTRSAVKFEPRSCQEMEQQYRASSASPHPSPYHANNTVFNYSNNGMQRSSASPMSPHRQMQPSAPHSPYSPHSQISPVSPRNPAAMSPHSRSNSCSPVHPYLNTVFGRYADTNLDMSGYVGGYASDMHNLKRMDKNSESYRAKRERNNIAVRRSREKKKQREIENEVRVQELTDENSKLQNRLDVVIKEMKLLKSLYQSIGASLPNDAQMKLERELSKLTN